MNLEDLFEPCCTRDERRPLEPALQDVGSNQRKLLRHNGRGGVGFGKRQDLILSGEGQGEDKVNKNNDLSDLSCLNSFAERAPTASLSVGTIAVSLHAFCGWVIALKALHSVV